MEAMNDQNVPCNSSLSARICSNSIIPITNAAITDIAVIVIL